MEPRIWGFNFIKIEEKQIIYFEFKHMFFGQIGWISLEIVYIIWSKCDIFLSKSDEGTLVQIPCSDLYRLIDHVSFKSNLYIAVNI